MTFIDDTHLESFAASERLDERRFAGRAGTLGDVSRPAVLYGMVLAGGHSRRMGRDKNTLPYCGQPHARYTAGLLSEVCAEVFYSCRPDQVDDALFADREKLADSFPGLGPLGGILSAFEWLPEAAFLVAACDLPFLTREALSHLIRQRDPARLATAFENPRRGKPEPLCAIYEPGFFQEALKWMDQGIRCPTDLLLSLDAARILPPPGDFLQNANGPDEAEKAMAALAGELTHA